MDECDVVVPRSCIADYIKFTHRLAEKLNLRIPSFGHAGDGNLHIYLCRDAMSRQEFAARCKDAFAALYARAAQEGGKISGEHGIGYAKKGYLQKQIPPAELALMRGIKAVFDPQNLLNPDKVCE